MHITEIVTALLIGAFIVATIEEGYNYIKYERKNTRQNQEDFTGL